MSQSESECMTLIAERAAAAATLHRICWRTATRVWCNCQQEHSALRLEVSLVKHQVVQSSTGNLHHLKSQAGLNCQRRYHSGQWVYHTLKHILSRDSFPATGQQQHDFSDSVSLQSQHRIKIIICSTTEQESHTSTITQETGTSSFWEAPKRHDDKLTTDTRDMMTSWQLTQETWCIHNKLWTDIAAGFMAPKICNSQTPLWWCNVAFA